VAIQFKGLANGRDCTLDGSHLDLEAMAQVSSSSLFNEGLKDGNLVFVRYALKVWFDPSQEELLPFAPVMDPLLVVCSHHANGDMVVCRTE